MSAVCESALFSEQTPTDVPSSFSPENHFLEDGTVPSLNTHIVGTVAMESYVLLTQYKFSTYITAWNSFFTLAAP